jgi:uncharacterized membrane protein YhhN
LPFPSFLRATAVVALLLALASPAAAIAPPDPWYVKAGNIAAKTFDVVLLRPLGLAATIGGFGCFAIALPFSAINRDINSPWETFVIGPTEFTFTRPLGDF